MLDLIKLLHELNKALPTTSCKIYCDWEIGVIGPCNIIIDISGWIKGADYHMSRFFPVKDIKAMKDPIGYITSNFLGCWLELLDEIGDEKQKQKILNYKEE